MPERRKEPRLVPAPDAQTILRRAGGGVAAIVRVYDISSRGISVGVEPSVAPSARALIVDAFVEGTFLEFAALPTREYRELQLLWSRREKAGVVILGGAFAKPLPDVRKTIAGLSGSPKDRARSRLLGGSAPERDPSRGPRRPTRRDTEMQIDRVEKRARRRKAAG